MKYSVIILMFHRNQELVDMAKRCVQSVMDNKPEDTEIIIVDNGSTMGAEWPMADTYIRVPQQRGCAGGWNLGINVARGKYINILGDDTIVEKGWLDKMSAMFELPQAGITNVHVEHLPKYEGIMENYRWFSYACFMLQRKTIDRIGLFDEQYFPVNYEDCDYTTRILKAGMKLYVDYSMTIKHLEGQTSKAEDIKKGFDANKQRFINKWGFDPIPVLYQDKPFPF